MHLSLNGNSRIRVCECASKDRQIDVLRGLVDSLDREIAAKDARLREQHENIERMRLAMARAANTSQLLRAFL